MAQDQIKKVAAALSRHTGQVESTAVSHLWRWLSVTLQKATSAANASRMEGARPREDGRLYARYSHGFVVVLFSCCCLVVALSEYQMAAELNRRRL